MKNLFKPSNSKSAHNMVLAAVLLCLFVILWGAWVRISGSGDGCGDHWPLCHDQIIPTNATRSTWIELTHRLTSGLFGLLVIFLFFKFRRVVGPIKIWALWSLILTITEALIGAKLVLFGLVGQNDSIFRLMIMSFHTLNSFALMGALSALWAHLLMVSSNMPAPKKSKWFYAFVFLFLGVLITGSQASLSGTLFPSQSLWEGIMADLSKDSHWIIRLRVLHPFLALVFCLSLATYLYKNLNDKITSVAFSFLIAQFVVGIATLLSLSPVWLKLTHLAFAHILWIILVFWLVSRKQSASIA